MCCLAYHKKIQRLCQTRIGVCEQDVQNFANELSSIKRWHLAIRRTLYIVFQFINVHFSHDQVHIERIPHPPSYLLLCEIPSTISYSRHFSVNYQTTVDTVIENRYCYQSKNFIWSVKPSLSKSVGRFRLPKYSPTPYPRHSHSVVQWLERWPWKAKSAQQWWFEPNSPSVVSGVATSRLANLPEKNSVAYIWA